MTCEPSDNHAGPTSGRCTTRLSAFTLVELLTVVFIISLLIGILIPSINAARTAAKKLTSAKILDAIEVGLEMFKNDNETDFRQTNGYPPSFSHPPLSGYNFNAYLGEFPFLDPTSNGTPPVVYGAHWLPAMLMGADGLGYVQRASVPALLRDQPWCWYPNPDIDVRTCTNDDRPPSMPFYLDPGNTRTLMTGNLPGNPPTDTTLFPNRDILTTLPVIVDSFDQPVLYYVANTYGRDTNMLADFHDPNNSYTGGVQREGPPFYFHHDNDGFTGTATLQGWNFGGAALRSGQLLHPIAMSGADLIPANLRNEPDAFANYILDRQVARGLEASQNAAALTTLRPVNMDTFLLITAGPDGRFGTKDDVTNLPKKAE